MTGPWIEIEQRGEHVIARWQGDVDLANADDIASHTIEAVENRHQRIVVDLASVTYVDSAGVRVLIQLWTQLADRQQELALALPNESVLRRALEIAGVLGTIPTFTSVAAALEPR